MACSFLVSLLALLPLLATVHSQAIKGGGRDGNPEPVQPGSMIFDELSSQDCLRFFRELNGVCTNDASRVSKLWGSTGRPQFSYLNRATSNVRGSRQQSPRFISNTLFKQTRELFDENGVAEIATFVGQFLDHSIVATPSNKDEDFSFRAPPGDSKAQAFFRSKGISRFEFKRSQRVFVKLRDNSERPSNALPSAVDLVSVYGPNKIRSNAVRSGVNGRLKVSTDGKNLLPKNTGRYNNAPDPFDNSFFLAGDHRANEHPVLTSIHTLFMREHNKITDELKANRRFSSLSDEELYSLAKRINEIQYQKMVFEEWFPRITGRKLPKYKGFVRKTDPTVSISFSTAGYRVGHTMVGNTVKFFEPGNRLNPAKTLGLTKTFFQAVKTITDNGIEPFLRGAMSTRAQKVDLLVVDALRDHLFQNVAGEDANFDLIALNIQRGRDHALPSYNALRNRFATVKAIRFSDVSSDANVQRKLALAYKSPGRIEAFPGLLAEDHVSGSSFGPTLFGLWRQEFRRLRDGDRLFFRARNAIPPQLLSLPRVDRVLNNKNFEVFRQMLLDNTNIAPSDLPNKLFKVNWF